jgi:predicted MPP superfamily phosphohydrolase
MVRVLPYLLSQYAWLVVTGLFLLIGILVTPTRAVGAIYSRDPNQPWNSSLRPRIVAHLSDIHLNSWLKNKSNRVYAVSPQIQRLGADPVLLSGDLVDDREDDFQIGEQQARDWDYYDSVLNNTAFCDLLDIPGNHDEFGVARFDSASHHILKYSRYLRAAPPAKIADFWAMQNISARADRETIEIISLNPLRYPTPHAKLGFWIYPTTEMLDAIETRLMSPDSLRTRILQCHYPLNLWSTTTVSSSGRTIRDIVSSANISLMLTGHLHPERAVFLHYQGLFEVVGPDLRFHQRFGLVTVDNSRVVYHQIDLGASPFAVVSHPVPARQLSNTTVFSELGTDVRVIVFSNNQSLNIRAVSGAVNHSLIFQASLGENISLYSCPLDVRNQSGIQHLNFSGDWEFEMDFVIGDFVTDLPDEVIYGFENFQITAYVAAGVLFGFLLIITFPFGSIRVARDCHEWIVRIHNETNWIIAICAGFLVARERIRLLPIYLRVALLIAVIWAVCGPLMFMTIESLFGMIWAWGFLVGGVQHYDFYGPVFAVIYLVTIVFPFTAVAGQIGLGEWSLAFVADYLVLLGGIAGSIAVGYIWGVSAAGIAGVATSPAYVIWPICLIVLFAIAIARRAKGKRGDLLLWSEMHA